jgi:hypothetical protein
MSRVLEQTGNRVISSDLYDRGFGEIGHDVLTTDRGCDNIVTNPPYNSAEGFVRSGLRSARRKLCLLLRLGFLEGANRHRTIFATTAPSRVWVFSERITFYLHEAIPKGSGTTAYAWFVWDKDAPSRTEMRWLEPGLRARCSKPGLVGAAVWSTC